MRSTWIVCPLCNKQVKIELWNKIKNIYRCKCPECDKALEVGLKYYAAPWSN